MCQFAIVGGGWAGVYTAWRLAVDSKRFRGDEVCLFEAGVRWGGRVDSVRASQSPLMLGVTLDLGAYRFMYDQHLPADLIGGPLKLHSRCYLSDCSMEEDEYNVPRAGFEPRTQVNHALCSAVPTSLPDR